MTDLGNRIADRYRLDALLGAGSGGRVFAALDEQTGTRVAVKRLAATPARAFDVERGALHSVRHPHLLSALDAGRDAQGAFLVTELMEGGDLTGVAKPLDSATLHALTTQALEALAYLHAQGILHGDVKTENVFVQSLDPPHFRLGDFGLSRFHSEVGGATRGSPAFMPPEVIRGEPADERSDLYALGCTLYECAFGALPFTDADVRQILLSHLNETPARLSDSGGVDVRLVRLLRSLLAKEPASRPMDARAALAAWRGEEAAAPRWAPPRLGVLIGRDAELAALERALANPAVAAVTLEGPAGVGKTRLLREFALRAELSGAVATWFTPRDLAELSTDLPSGDDTRALSVVRAAEVRRRLGDGRWVLVIDDVDDASPSLREAVAFLLRDLSRDATPERLAVVSGRGEASSLVRDALASGDLAPAPTMILHPWERSDVEAAASALFGARRLEPALVELIHAASSGIPAEVEVVGQRLVRDDLLRVETEGRLATVVDLLPADIVEPHSDRFARTTGACSRTQREILETLALLRTPGTLAFIAALHPEYESDLIALQRSGLVIASRGENQSRHALAHEGVRRFLRANLDRDARSQLHDRIATMLSMASHSMQEEDHRWHEVCGTNLGRARSALRQIVARPHSAAQPELLRECYATVLANWPYEVDPPERMRTQVDFVAILLRLGNHADADACIEDALTRADPETRCLLVDMRAQMHIAMGHPQLALDELESISADSVGELSEPRLAALVTRGEALGILLRYSESLAAFAIVQPSATAGTPLFDRLLNPLVMSLGEVGRLAEAEATLEVALRYYQESGDQRGAAVSVNRLGMVAFKRGDMQLAFERFEEALRLFRGHRDTFGTLLALNGLGAAASELAHFAAAKDYFRAAIDLGQRLGDTQNLSFQLGNLALTLGTVGEYVEAMSLSRRAQEFATQRHIHVSLIAILIGRAGLEATLGMESASRATLKELSDTNPPDFYRAQAHLIQAQLDLQASHLSSAREQLGRAATMLRVCSADDELIVHDLLLARVEWIEGNHSEAIQILRGACDVADTMQLRLTRTHLDAMLGEFLVELHAPEAAVHVMAGLESANKMGVPEVKWRCERALGRIGALGHDLGAARLYYGHCLSTLQDTTALMSAEMASSYLAVPDRRRVFDEISRLPSPPE